MSRTTQATDDRRTAVNETFEQSFRRLSDHSPTGAARTFGSVTAISAGVPTPVFNRVFIFQPPEREELRSAVAWLRERDDPFWVTADASFTEGVAAVGSELALEPSEGTQPGMTLAPLEEISSGDSPAVIEAATDAAALDDWREVAVAVFGFSPETVNRLTPPTVLAADELQYFVGRVDGDAVACGLLVRVGDVAGVYTIGVLEEYRRRGIGEAMTRTVLAAGRDRGCQIGILQSSQSGVPLYKGMGFETVVEYRHWRPDT